MKPAGVVSVPQVDQTILENRSSQDNPVFDKTYENKNDIQEYGYGFWLRFLSVYPERLSKGKN